jgi:hypothetical protein
MKYIFSVFVLFISVYVNAQIGDYYKQQIKTIAQLKTFTPADGSIYQTAEYATGDGLNTGARYVYSLFSTATADNRVIIAPNSSIGRYLIIPDEFNLVRTRLAYIQEQLIGQVPSIRLQKILLL